MRLLNCFTFFIFLLAVAEAHSQVDYSLQVDSLSYQPLSNGTVVPFDPEGTGKIVPGFPVVISGQASDTLIIKRGGLVTSGNFAFSALVSARPTSSVSYEISGVPGSRVLSIEFSQVSVDGFDCPDSICYIFSFMEGTNSVQFHQGAYLSTGCNLSDTTYSYKPVVGCFRVRGGYTATGLTGDENNPALVAYPDGDVVYLNRMPQINRRYLFTPVQ